MALRLLQQLLPRDVVTHVIAPFTGPSRQECKYQYWRVLKELKRVLKRRRKQLRKIKESRKAVLQQLQRYRWDPETEFTCAICHKLFNRFPLRTSDNYAGKCYNCNRKIRYKVYFQRDFAGEIFTATFTVPIYERSASFVLMGKTFQLDYKKAAYFPASRTLVFKTDGLPADLFITDGPD